MATITHNYLKSISYSDWKNIIIKVKSNLIDNEILAIEQFELILNQLKLDEKNLLSNNFEAISDCALFAPRHATRSNHKDNKIRLAYHAAKRYFIDTGRIKEQLHANIHWQRLIAKLSKTFLDMKLQEAAIKEEFKTSRLLEHLSTKT